MGALPVFSGKIITDGSTDRGILFDYLSGLFFMMAVFQAVTLPCIYFDTSLNFDIAVWMIAMAAVLLFLALKNRRKKLTRLRAGENLSDGPEAKRKNDPLFWVIFALALLFIIFQTYMAVRYAHYDEDDAYYVAMATTAWSTNSLMRFNPYTGARMVGFYSRYVLSPFSLFVAVEAKLTFCHAAVVAHTFYPGCYIPASYMVYALIAKKLFPKKRVSQAKLVLLIAIMGIFSLWSRRNQMFFLLSKTWQGKAVLAGVLLPAMFFLMMKHWEGSFCRRDWMICVFLTASMTLVSSMGIMLGVIMAGIYAIVLIVMRRDFRGALKIMMTTFPNIILGAIYTLAF
jgi:hypothetical protein